MPFVILMSWKRQIVLVMTAALVTAAFVWPPQFGQTQVKAGAMRVAVEDGSELTLYEESHAIVIGASAYDKDKGWETLPGVLKDVTEVSSALEAQGFSVERL